MVEAIVHQLPYKTLWEYEGRTVQYCSSCALEIEDAENVWVTIKPHTYKGNTFYSIWHLECWRKKGKADVTERN